jgi:hypothetical protein
MVSIDRDFIVIDNKGTGINLDSIPPLRVVIEKPHTVGAYETNNLVCGFLSLVHMSSQNRAGSDHIVSFGAFGAL